MFPRHARVRVRVRGCCCTGYRLKLLNSYKEKVLTVGVKKALTPAVWPQADMIIKNILKITNTVLRKKSVLWKDISWFKPHRGSDLQPFVR